MAQKRRIDDMQRDADRLEEHLHHLRQQIDEMAREEKRSRPVPPKVRPAGYKRQVCKYWKEGRCRNNRASCNFAHGDEDRRGFYIPASPVIDKEKVAAEELRMYLDSEEHAEKVALLKANLLTKPPKKRLTTDKPRFHAVVEVMLEASNTLSTSQ
jgi:hypothetical protein